MKDVRILIRGAGDLASGVAHRLHRCGLAVALTEVPAPLAIRRAVSFCEAVWDGACEVEGVRARKVAGPEAFDAVLAAGELPVLVDPELTCLAAWRPRVLVDATLAKRNLGIRKTLADLVVGLGPGFTAGDDVHVVVETNRGHDLGRLLFEGTAEPDTGVPGLVGGYGAERLVRAPRRGRLAAVAAIGDAVVAGQTVATVEGHDVPSPLAGVLRGLIRDGSRVREGLKIGDVDPRARREHCFTISDKARALGGSVLEAVLMHLRGAR